MTSSHVTSDVTTTTHSHVATFILRAKKTVTYSNKRMISGDFILIFFAPYALFLSLDATSFTSTHRDCLRVLFLVVHVCFLFVYNYTCYRGNRYSDSYETSGVDR